MKVNLNIEEDEQFRKYVKDLIGGQVRSVLREELGGIVAGEIAKLRILQPGSPTLGAVVEKQVNAEIAKQVSPNNIRAAMHKEVLAIVTPMVATLASDVKTAFQDQLKTIIK